MPPVLAQDVNIALQADEINTSHVSPWENLYAINNGSDPQHSGDNSMGAYGNWDGSNARWHWVEYRWDDYYIISQSDVYWWADGSGIVIPYDTYQEYWNVRENRWELLPNADGNGVERDMYNITTFDPVVTNRIRVNMVSTISTGILEWRVWGHREDIPVKSTASIDRPVEPGYSSTVTLTAIDQQDNMVADYPFTLRVDVTDKLDVTDEEYFINGMAVTGSIPSMALELTDENGQVSFTVEMPEHIDPGDGIEIQVYFKGLMKMDDADFSYIEKGVEPSGEEIFINEIMASNASSIADEDGDFGDWIELFNKGDMAVNLEGSGLSDDYENPFRWVFPDINIYPGEYLLVWATGKDRKGGQLHTNFRISRDGEEVILTSPGGTRIDEIPPTPVPTDLSYGRYPDGGKDLYYFDKPTPGSSNNTGVIHGFLDDVVFSEEAGFYNEDISLELSHPDPEAVIYYTTDGALPDTLSERYTGPLILTDRSDEPNSHSTITNTPLDKVAKNNIVRAVAVKPGYLNSPVSTASYFIFPGESDKYSITVASLVTNYEFLFSDSVGIYVSGNHNNFNQRGVEWERPASIEFFSDDLNFQQDIGIRIHGSGTRGMTQKSLRIYARSMYGENRIYQKIFPELPYENYNRLIFRNSGNDWGDTMFRDAAIQTICGGLNFDIQAYRPLILFINGEYWGIHNIRERYDKHYIARVYGVDPENIDLLTTISQSSDQPIVKEGDSEHYLAMIEYLENNDMADDNHYEHIKTRMDISNFTDYQIANIYASNADWPGNNMDYWRLRTDYDPDAGAGHDGRWRWLMFDTDFGFNMLLSYNRGGVPSHNTLAFATQLGGTGWPNPEWTTFLLRAMLENGEFRTGFINRFSDLLNTVFLPGRVAGIINDMKYALEPEMPDHIIRWNRPHPGMSRWYDNVGAMIDFAYERPGYQRDHIRSYFNLGNDVEIELSVDDPEKGFTRINTIDIIPTTPGIGEQPYPWTGIYFQGVPVRVEAVPRPGYRFSHWTGTDESRERVLNFNPVNKTSLKAHFVKEDETSVISYWFFGGEMPNNTPLDVVEPVYSVTDNAHIEFLSCLPGYPYHEDHEYWRVGSMERRNSPTALNYYSGLNGDTFFDESGMRGLQVRQPMSYNGDQSSMTLHLPTDDHTDIVLMFAARDEGAARELLLDYSVSAGEPEWKTLETAYYAEEKRGGKTVGENTLLELQEDYLLYVADFTDIPQAGDNNSFRVRIRFVESEPGSSEGNRVTFNNISLHGRPAGIVSAPGLEYGALKDVVIYPNPASDVLRIRFNQEPEHDVFVSLLNISGSVVAETSVRPGDGGEAYIQLQGLNPGVYIARIKYGGHLLSRRVVVF